MEVQVSYSLPRNEHSAQCPLPPPRIVGWVALLQPVGVKALFPTSLVWMVIAIFTEHKAYFPEVSYLTDFCIYVPWSFV